MKKYTIQIEIPEGSDEFWDEINKRGSTGCDEVIDELKSLLEYYYTDYKVSLVSFEDK